MKKTLILVGIYVVASFLGAFTGALLWGDPFRMNDILGFMMICPLFQFFSLITGFNTNNPILGILLLVVCGGTMIASAIGYYKSNRNWLALTFAVPVFVASLQGANLLCEAVAA